MSTRAPAKVEMTQPECWHDWPARGAEATVTVTADCLHCAWQAAEAALPEGWWYQLDGHAQGEHRASAGEPKWSREYQRVEATGPTPTAALQALAAELRRRGHAERDG